MQAGSRGSIFLILDRDDRPELDWSWKPSLTASEPRSEHFGLLRVSTGKEGETVVFQGMVAQLEELAEAILAALPATRSAADIAEQEMA